ncbi:MAG TPA: Xaa-Pro peptidase family protein [Gaiellaceae bacterium]|nr:Xaa-Pro peptidase family protein [Gaiellaceae bacterium]
MAPCFRPRRRRRAPRRREGARRLQGGTGIPGTRIDRLRALLEEPLLVSAPTNVLYLTGFESTNAALLVEPDRVRLFTDFRYAERARELEVVEVEETKRHIFSDLEGRLPARVGFEAAAVSYADHRLLSGAGAELVPRTGLVESLRAVKEPEELDTIRRAAAITDRAYERLVEERFSGRTEKELVWRMTELFHELGADEPAFAIDIAAGPTAASPHAMPGERVVQEGDLVLVDAGAKLEGYCSDCTRTFAVADVSDSLREIYDVTRQAQQAGLDAVRAGTTGQAADAAARAVIADAGYGEQFGHGLGHGLGLLVHEAPVLRPESTDTLQAGNVVTVEPGIYLSGVAGVRIEDLVVVTDDGCEVLSSFPKELVTVA